jgi:glyoxylase-like metal-dependent hydrolase (beta-lactamase superfamily II)
MVDDNTEILDSISTLSFYGHTTGQQLIKIESEDTAIIFCADLIPLKSHLRLPWIMGYDLSAKTTLEEKTQFLNQASENGWYLYFYHDPRTVAVKIKKGEKYFDIIEEYSVDE